MTFLVGPEIASKQLQLLKEPLPSASRVAVLANPSNRLRKGLRRRVGGARHTGVRLRVVNSKECSRR